MQTFRRNTFPEQKYRHSSFSPLVKLATDAHYREKFRVWNNLSRVMRWLGHGKVPLFSVLYFTPQPTSPLSCESAVSSPLRFVAVSCKEKQKSSQMKPDAVRADWQDRVPVKVLISFPDQRKMSQQALPKLLGGTCHWVALNYFLCLFSRDVMRYKDIFFLPHKMARNVSWIISTNCKHEIETFFLYLQQRNMIVEPI